MRDYRCVKSSASNCRFWKLAFGCALLVQGGSEAWAQVSDLPLIAHIPNEADCSFDSSGYVVVKNDSGDAIGKADYWNSACGAADSEIEKNEVRRCAKTSDEALWVITLRGKRHIFIANGVDMGDLCNGKEATEPSNEPLPSQIERANFQRELKAQQSLAAKGDSVNAQISEPAQIRPNNRGTQGKTFEQLQQAGQNDGSTPFHEYQRQPQPAPQPQPRQTQSQPQSQPSHPQATQSPQTNSNTQCTGGATTFSMPCPPVPPGYIQVQTGVTCHQVVDINGRPCGARTCEGSCSATIDPFYRRQ